ncbi:hypothetical protein HDV04_004196 [Boothiomyces sp. JEL0838]|nr:hypothetical protein HDV04_004196 [Boothiomyces sp. JEL0838]
MGITLTASVPNDGVFFAAEPEPEIVQEPSQSKLRSTLSIDTLRSFAGSLVESFTGSSQQEPLPADTVKPRVFDHLTRTKSMSGELQPVVEVLGKKIESIPEDAEVPPRYPSRLDSKTNRILHNDPLEESFQLLPEEGGKLELEKVREKSVNKRQSTIFSGQNEVEQPAVFNKNPRGELKKETIAWAFAQVLIDPNYIKESTLELLKSKIMYKTPGTTSANSYGGGTLSTNEKHLSRTGIRTFNKVQNGLPLYNTPPTILFCDQEIPVGESRSYTYEIQLPSVLPPSHRGKLIRFTYKLIIGIQKSAVSRVTQVVTIPFRFFNRTNNDGSRPVFEILNPVISNKDESRIQSTTSPGLPSPVTSKPPSPALKTALSPNTSGGEMETSTIDNILGLLQMSGKETADPAFANKPKNQIQNHTRICYGEFHQTTLNSRRVVVSLNIPSKCTPDFQTSAVSLQWSVRFEFITGAGKRIQNTSNIVDGYVHSRAIPRVDVEPFDCVVPLKVYGALKTTKQRRKVLEFEIN